jgi:acyl-CoA carboxylase epsilon subunit
VSGDGVPANSGMRSRGGGDSRRSEAEEQVSDTSATPTTTATTAVSGDGVPANSAMRSRGGGDSQRSEAEEQVSDTSATPEAPHLTVVSKHATPEEIAALVVALAALRPNAPPPPRPRSRWADPARMMRPQLAHGHGGWAASALPR